ncbi:MAG: UvrD-helicase domain-containing protein [Bacteroidia bacterium]
MGLVIYKSSAGSGKTFTLVSIFLTKVIRHPWLFRRILAITFTNKATEELKTRIIRELDQLAAGKASSYLQPVQAALPKLTEEEIRANAGIVLSKIIHDYSSFHISTIDSFFQTLSRVLAREMQLPMKYEIELDTEAICRDITEMLLDDAGKNEQVTEWLEEMLLDRIENNKSWNISAELSKMTRQLLQADEARNWAGKADMMSLTALIKWMVSVRKEIETTMRGIGREVEESLKKYQLSPENFYQKKSGPVGYLIKIASKKSGAKEFGNVNSYTQKALEDPKQFLSKNSQQDSSLLTYCTDYLHPQLVKAIDYYEANQRKYLTVYEALKLIFQSGIVGALDERLKAYREKHQLFHLSDTTRMLSKAIESQDAPFIYEKSGNSFIHIFIDEFQDTSEEQWEILKPLVMNTLGTGNDVYIVGDAKQSIYRWRGGEMQLIVEGVRKALSHTGFIPEDRILGTNWRSRKEIVAFNNLFFPQAAEMLSRQFPDIKNKSFEAYRIENVEQQPGTKSTQPGYLDFRFFTTDKEKSPEGDTGTLHWKTKALLQMEKEIHQLLSAGYRFQDIVILVRGSQHENEIADFLFKSGEFPFLSSNALQLKNNNKVIFILNCLRLLVNDKQPLLHAEVNRFTGEHIEEFSIPYHRKELETTDALWSHRCLSDKAGELRLLPLQFVFLYLLDAGQLSKNDPFIQKLSELIDDFANSKGNSISGFLTWWDEHADTRNWSVELPDGGNAIRILTIHKSKGLEFPIVFIPFLDWPYVPKPQSIIWAEAENEIFSPFGKLPVYAVKTLEETWFNKDYRNEVFETSIDNLNLLYVAFTRPETHLFVYAPLKPKENEVAKLLIEIFSSNEALNALLTAEGTLSLGEKTKKEAHTSSLTANTIYQPAGFTPRDIKATKEELILPSLRLAYSSEEIILGNLVHEVLEITKSKDDISNAVNRVLRRENNRAYYDLLEKIVEDTTEIWNLLERHHWTAEHYVVSSEIEICDENGKIHRPDKIFSKTDATIIIDFKTGKTETSHHQQVQEYCRLLSALGKPNISAYLIYTSEKEAVKVEWPVTNVTGQTRLFN